jgi:hypothetical protein
MVFSIVLCSVFILGVFIIFKAHSIGKAYASRELSIASSNGLSNNEINSITTLTTFTYLALGFSLTLIGGLGFIFILSRTYLNNEPKPPQNYYNSRGNYPYQD